MNSSIARLITVGALALGLAACGENAKKAQIMQANLIQPDCYTVDPYHPIRISKPKNEVPEQMKAFLGAWGGGAWDGTVCHDLWIMQVDPNGRALMFDAHGPGYFPEATAFTRKGEITEDGKLVVRKGPATVVYWIQDGHMYGERRIGKQTNRIIMTRQAS